MGALTTHVLDIAHGRPAAGMKVRLYLGSALLIETVTNADGRVAGALIQGEKFRVGNYRLEFLVGDYFAAARHPDAKRFLDVVPVSFIVVDPEQNYHVPLLVSVWSYSTYRGS
ncbi:MAG TPA: hydroxyisourate hydrolase [Phycisphaerae bacterium]|nr:hydroxyisourate hydrolase [Phycisphaerae bacterium]